MPVILPNTSFLLREDSFPFPHSLCLTISFRFPFGHCASLFLSRTTTDMPRLIPSEEFTIPVHQSTPGWDTEQLAVEKHAYPAPSNTSQERIAFLWAHANGFSKEMMHPLMRRFATQLRSLPSFQSITFDFYGFDARYSGDSACLNNGHPFNPKCKVFLSLVTHDDCTH